MNNELVVDSAKILHAEIGPLKVMNMTPVMYRPARKKDGTIILQGAFQCQEGWNQPTIEWQEIPIVDLED